MRVWRCGGVDMWGVKVEVWRCEDMDKGGYRGVLKNPLY